MYVKVAEPNVWRLRAHVVWESHFGNIPKACDIHHIDGDKLNDAISNLRAVSRAQHLDLHRREFQERATQTWVEKRKKERWSTKSTTKRTGRHPANCDCPIHKASR